MVFISWNTHKLKLVSKGRNKYQCHDYFCVMAIPLPIAYSLIVGGFLPSE